MARATRSRTGSTPSSAVALVASGDLREEANRVCWPAQQQLEAELGRAIKDLGGQIERAHPVSRSRGHGFIGSAKEGLEVFAGINPQSPLIVAEAVWQYSNHVLPGLSTHRGPILTLANWSGQKDSQVNGTSATVFRLTDCP